jgi:hypothetical protein
LALTRIGNKRQIASLTEGTTEADLCNLHYARTRDAVLRAFPWAFAITRVSLSQDSSYTSVFEFDYRFLLPTDCIKVVRTQWDADGYAAGGAVYGFPGIHGYFSAVVPYRIEGRYLLCNDTTAAIEYIKRETDPAQFDDLFVDVLAQRLAAEICPALTDNATMANNLWQVYTAKLNEARSTSAQEGSPRDVIDASAWITARV